MHGPFRDMQTHGLCFQILKSHIYSFPKGIPLRTDLPVHADCSLVTQSCLTHCNAMDCSPPGSSVHEISQTRLLEWVAISFSRGSSQPRDQTHVTCIGRWTLLLNHQGSSSMQIIHPESSFENNTVSS